MQFVESNDLKPGMRLAKPVYNKMGVLLYDRNSYLTASGIKSIEEFRSDRAFYIRAGRTATANFTGRHSI